MKEFSLIFESDRIYFVRVSEYLIDDYLEMINDEEVQKTISNNRKTYSREEEIEWVKMNLKEKKLVLSMMEKSTNEFIGNIEIMNIHNNIGTIGIVITPKKQNKRFGQEAIKALIKYATAYLQLDGLELNVFDFNPRGIKCYEATGFVKDSYDEEKNEYHMTYRR